MKNAKDLEELRTRQLVLDHLNNWLQSGQTRIDLLTLDMMVSCIKRIMQEMTYDFDRNLLLVTVIYAERYVKFYGQIRTTDCFQLLLLSSMVTAKMWFDTGKIST